MERLRKLFNEETRFHDVLGGIYAITYKGKSVTARTPEKLWKKLEAERRDNCDHIEVEEGESLARDRDLPATLIAWGRAPQSQENSH